MLTCLTVDTAATHRPALLRRFGSKFGASSPNRERVGGVAGGDSSSGGSGRRPPASSLSAGLVQILREVVPSLGADSESADMAIPSGERTLYSLGIDSLTLALVRTALQTRFSLNIPLARLAGATLYDLNAAMLGGGVESLPDGEDGPASLTAEVETICAEWSSSITRADTDAGDVGGGGGTADARSRGSTVFLTGVTGYVGPFLMNELLHRDPTLHVICMARAPNDAAATDRVEKTLQQYQLNCKGRWNCIAGDLAAGRRLGLSQAGWDDLVSTVDAVYHVGAVVNGSLPLAAIRPANIGGSKTVIELCIAANAVLHYISTASVLAGSGITREIFEVPPPSKHATAYAKSKWVAEQLVGYATKVLGLHAKIYRLGTMAAHSVSGACNLNDTFTRIVQGLILMNARPADNSAHDDSGGSAARQLPPPPDAIERGFYLAAIDWAVRAVCNIAEAKNQRLEQPKARKKHAHAANHVNTEVVEVVHILATEITPMSAVYDAIAAHGIKLFQSQTLSVDETNPIYSFRDALLGVGSAPASVQNRAAPLSTANARLHTEACPPARPVLARMLTFLYPRGAEQNAPVDSGGTPRARIFRLKVTAV